MDFLLAAETAQGALWQVILIAGPVLLISVLVGLTVSVIQTAFSVQEQTLTFVPKIIAILMTIALLSTWMATQMAKFTFDLFTRIPVHVREDIQVKFGE